MKNKILILALAMAAAGCAANAQRDYLPPKAGAGTWRFEGHEGQFGKLTISINGTPVLVGSVSVWSGAGEIAGTYEGHTVAATCAKPRNSDVRTQCDVTVDGEKATSLNFRVK